MNNLIFFDNEVNQESITRLINSIEEFSTKKVVIYFSSSGGAVSYAELFIDYINTLCKKEITLIGYNLIESCAFDIFLRCNCKKVIKSTCSIMVHSSKPTINGKVVDGKKKFKDDSINFFFENIDLTKKKYLRLYAIKGIPQELLEEIKKGNDVKISIALMRRIIK